MLQKKQEILQELVMKLGNNINLLNTNNNAFQVLHGNQK